MVRGRVGQEVHLVAQRALVQIEVDRRRVAAVAAEAHVPARDLGSYSTVCTHGSRATGPSRCAAISACLPRGTLVERRASSARRSVAANERARDEVAVEPAQARRGDAPRVPTRPRGRVRAHRRPRARGRRAAARPARRSRRGRARRRGSRCCRRRRASAARRPPRRPPACRTPRPRARRARTTRCATGPGTRRRRGRSRRGASWGCGGTNRTWSVDAELVDQRVERAPAPPRRRRRSARRRPASVACGSSSAARQRTARSTPFSGWIRPTNSSTRPAVEAEARAARARAVAGCEHRVVDAGRRRSRCDRGRRRRASRAARARRRSTRASGRRRRSISCSMRARELGVVVDAGVGLHPRERVERRDERQVELVLELVPDARPRASSSRAARRPVASLEQRRVERASTNGSTSSSSVVLRRPARAGPPSRCTTRKPGSTSTTVGLLGMLGARVARRTRRRPAPARTRARARRRSCRRRRPRPAARAATCAR